MYVVIRALDDPNSSARAALYEQHRAYLDQQPLAIFAAGPLFGPSGEEVIGSLFIIECERYAQANAFIAGEPFNCAGLYQQVSIERWQRRR